mgnify:CR=1 FL=1
MTVESQIPYQSYIANGLQTSFTLSFYVEDKGNFFVKKNDTVVSVNDYIYDSITNSITFNTAPPQDCLVEIERVTSVDRSTTYATFNNSFRPEVLNYDIDRIWRKLQELAYTDSVLFLKLIKEITDRTEGDTELQNQINVIDQWLENLQQNVNENTTHIGQLVNDLSKEIADRITGDQLLKDMFLSMIDEAINEGTVNALAVTNVDTVAALDIIQAWLGRVVYVKGVGNYRYDGVNWVLVGNSASSIFDASGSTQQQINDKNLDPLTGFTRTKIENVYDELGNTFNNIFKPYSSNFVFITDPRFDAKADGTDQTAKVQAALDYVGDYGTVYIPKGIFTINGTLRPRKGQSLIGFGMWSSVLQGNGTAPIVKTNDTISGTVRGCRLIGIGFDNFTKATTGGNYAVQWWATNDSHIQQCEFKAKGAESLHVKYSYRGSITQNRITSSGSSFAFALINNCNGMDCSNNTVSGGSAGGGVRVGMSQTINLSNTVIEVSGTCAVRIGGDDAEDGGRCTGINLKGLYAEQTKRVLEAGLKYECYNIDIDGFMINQASTGVISVYDEAMHLGRVNGLFFNSGFATAANQTAFIKFYDIASGVGLSPYLSSSHLCSKTIVNYTSMFSFDGTTQNFSGRIFGRNRIQLNSDEVIGSIQEYISPLITCNVAEAQKYCVAPSTYGGLILSIDILDATGSLDGTIRIGSSSSIVEILNKDLTTVTLNQGYANLFKPTGDNGAIRATGLLVSTLAGALTTKFRIRIRYRL